MQLNEKCCVHSLQIIPLTFLIEADAVNETVMSFNFPEKLLTTTLNIIYGANTFLVHPIIKVIIKISILLTDYQTFYLMVA